MGSCCFTPSKKDFLWWYWLLLASIVGIPMLLAVWYVASASEGDEDAKKWRGRTAAWIFWPGTFLVGIATFYIVPAVVALFYPGPPGYVPRLQRAEYRDGWIILAVQFFLATVAANGANDLTRKRKHWYTRIPVLILCMFGYLFFLAVGSLLYLQPAVNLMQFLVCMLPAHCWGRFKDTPPTDPAWKALWAFLAAALLFFLVSYFGEDFAQLIFRIPRSGK